MKLSRKQLDKLSDLFLDIAKGLFLAGLVVPAITTQATLFLTIKSVLIGCFFTYLSLATLARKEA